MKLPPNILLFCRERGKGKKGNRRKNGREKFVRHRRGFLRYARVVEVMKEDSLRMIGEVGNRTAEGPVGRIL